MNSVMEEMLAYLSDSEGDLAHIGMPRRSGRYPWGSGEDPYQRTRDLLARIDILKKDGWTETPENIMKEFGLTTKQYRTQKALAGNLRRLDKVATAESLKEDGLNNMEIGRKMGINESTVRSLLDQDRKERMERAINTADFIRARIEESGKAIDVGSDVCRELGISQTKFNEALLILESEGYVRGVGRMPQPTNKQGQMTTLNVIGPKDSPKNLAFDYENITSLKEYTSHDNGETFDKFVYPKSMDSKRLMVRYAEDGGINKDGIIELRRGVKDLSLGNDHYSQVRILVDNDRYLKGMALYSDDMPDGIDVIFNTNKTKDMPMRDVLKDANKNLKKDPDNPFGSLIKANGQSYYIDENGERQLSLINKRASEGDWSDWSNSVPSQFLSKQPVSMAKKQLGEAIKDKKTEYDDICNLTQPTVKRHLLGKFADECDSAAVHLKAAALPGQKYNVIIPINSLKDTEVYAPNYEDGTQLALVRYPHGGKFEIPILTVNNKHREAKKILGPDIQDAVGINKKVADRLSGADFDGDTVMCIPTHGGPGKTKVVNQDELKGLKGFDPKDVYGYDSAKKVDADGIEHYYRKGKEFKVMRNTQTEMGKISNLITDMTLLGAKDDELARAVRHSMVVIDAEKHKLDYKASEIDNDIASLKKKYQGGGGAATIISKAKGQYSVPKRQGQPIVNVPGATMTVKDKNGKYVKIDMYDPSKPEGSLIYKTAEDRFYPLAKVNKRSKGDDNATVRVSTRGKKYIEFDDSDEWIPIDGDGDSFTDGARVNASLKNKERMQKSTKMAETSDARTLISDMDSPMERAYADYANSMKAMANQARKEMMATPSVKTNAEAKTTYSNEVSSLKSKLNDARLNAPRERLALVKANNEIAAKKRSNPDIKPDEEKKLAQQAVSKYRNEVGAIKRRDRNIKITDREWEAIMAGAVNESTLKSILNNTDIDDLRQRATPKTTNTLSSAKISRARSMSASGYSNAEIAKKLGVSTTTLNKYLKGEN